MNQGLSINNLVRNLRDFSQKIAKVHYIISISLIVIGVAFTTYYINDILNNPPSTADVQKAGVSDKFDTETIKKIDTLKYRDETTLPPLPGGRINPFTE